MKAIFEIKKLIPSKQKFFKNGFKSLAAAAWMSIFIEMDSSFEDVVKDNVSATIDLCNEEEDDGHSTNLTSNIPTPSIPTTDTDTNNTNKTTTTTNDNSFLSAIEAESSITETSENSTSSTTNKVITVTTPTNHNTSTSKSSNIAPPQAIPTPQASTNNNYNTNDKPTTPTTATTNDSVTNKKSTLQTLVTRTRISKSYYDWISNLSTYVNMDKEKIRERVFMNLSETEGLDLMVLAENDNEKSNIIFHLHTFISSLFPLITTYITDHYNTRRREREAAAEAMAAVSTAAIEKTTQAIADIVGSEESMSCKYMKDYVGKDVTKKLKKALSKNLKGGKTVAFAKTLQSNKNTTTTPSYQSNPPRYNNNKDHLPPPSSLRSKQKQTVSPKFNNKWKRPNPQNNNNHTDHPHRHQTQNQRIMPSHQRNSHYRHPTPPGRQTSSRHIPLQFTPRHQQTQTNIGYNSERTNRHNNNHQSSYKKRKHHTPHQPRKGGRHDE